MPDTIVYCLIAKGGGVDGMDHTDKGGRITKAYLTRTQAEKDGNLPWNTIEPRVYDLDEELRKLLRTLDPVQRLALEHFTESNAKAKSSLRTHNRYFD